MKNIGFFVTFEGGEGSGKSTQAKILYDRLVRNNFDVILTREPGGSIIAELIREILVKGDVSKLEPISELFLFAAARYDHLNKTVNPALEDNKIVICDRFIDSTSAYQGYGGNINQARIDEINNISIGNSYPNLTFICDVETDIGLKRSLRETNNETRFEKKTLDYHNKIRDGYLEIALNNKTRCSVIDGSKNIDQVSEEIYKIFIDKIENYNA
ncbi:MAG: dTMP kinase [Hyphomicrobiales bacterium]|jgi:dTMP kinase|nr:dTMP kinase [Hyphomicrobiales bacterium]